MLRGLKMLCPVWALAVAALCVLAMEVSSQCWENPRCRYLTSEDNRLECIQLCRSDLTAETPVFPGEGHLQPPEPSETSEESNSLPALPPSAMEAPQDTSEVKQAWPRQVEQRTYAMEHFRWGKPVGRKRRPIKVFTNGVEEESAEALPAEMRRAAGDDSDNFPMGHFRFNKPRVLKRRPKPIKEEERSAEDLPAEVRSVAGDDTEKEDVPYVIKHFRWSAPEEESAEAVHSTEMRRTVADDKNYGGGAAEKEEQATLAGLDAKKDAKKVPYVIKHFRWSAPPASKRYGGFMKSWDERSQKPLMTLFKNVINKDGQQKKDQ